MMRIALLFGVLLASSASAQQPPLWKGQVRSIDTEYLAVGRELFRLSNMDAPDIGQSCANSQGVDYWCGVAARAYLDSLIRGREAVCEGRESSPPGSHVRMGFHGECKVDGLEIGRAMVLAGWALSAPPRSVYMEEQRQAHAAKRGLWARGFVEPWKWKRDVVNRLALIHRF